MKMKIWIYPLTLLGVLLMFSNSCKKDDNNSDNPTNGKTLAVFNPQLSYGILTDQDGNIYKTITIGSQTWMAENLRTTKYRNGDAIPEVTNYSAWKNLRTGEYCNYNNTKNNDTIATFGRLYNWFTIADSLNVCPTGWHIPADGEWTTLANYLIANGYNYDGTASGWFYAKALASNTGWASSTNKGAVGNTDYTAKRNATGFTALPAGYRGYNGFNHIGYGVIWWSSSEDNGDGRSLSLDYCDNYVFRHEVGKNFGFSVRCLRDY